MDYLLLRAVPMKAKDARALLARKWILNLDNVERITDKRSLIRDTHRLIAGHVRTDKAQPGVPYWKIFRTRTCREDWVSNVPHDRRGNINPDALAAADEIDRLTVHLFD